MAILVKIILIIGGGFLFYTGIQQLMKCKTEVEATIVDIVTKRSSAKRDHRRDRYPVLEFTADNGQVVHKTADVSSKNKNKYNVGDRLTIKYDPTNPESFIVKGKSLVWNLGLGGVLLAAGIVSLLL